jgi:hypothetical protein
LFSRFEGTRGEKTKYFAPKAVSFFTEKDDKKSLQAMIQQQVKKTIEKANALEVDNKARAHHMLSRIL